MTRLARLLGAPGIVGLGLLVSCAAFYASAVAPAERAVATRLAQADEARLHAPLHAVSAGNAAAELERFQSLFPSLDRLPQQLERLHRLARTAGLTPTRGEYRLEPLDGAILAYRATLPVYGHYEQVREFLGAVLHGMPTVSIDGLQFERKKVDERMLKSELHFTMYFRAAPEANGR